MNYKGFIWGSSESQAYTADYERTVNLYPERQDTPGATSPWALYPTPGVRSISGDKTGSGRAHVEAAGREFGVVGTNLFEFDVYGARLLRASVAMGATPATISYNGDGGDQLFITSGGNGYIYNMTTHVATQIAALDGKATTGDHLDGYFLALDANTSTFYISALLNGLTWNTGVDFAQRSQASDPWRAMKVIGKYVWLFGTETSEAWYDTGGSFPFAPHPSGLNSYGCAAAFSVRQVGSSLCWLGTTVSGGLYALQANGFAPEVISSIPHQLAMSKYATVSDAVADSYTDLGHTFYVLSFPTEDVTWAWDTTTGQWAERGTWYPSEARYRDWRPRYHAWVFGQHRMLDAEAGNLYHLSSDYSTDVSGLAIRRLRRAPCILAENQRVYYSSFELDIETGLGVEIGSETSSEPTANDQTSSQIMLRMSNDGGKNWGAELWRAMGKTGAYGFRVRWNRLGAARRRVFEVAFSSPVPFRICGPFLGLGQQPQPQGVGMAAPQ